MPPKRRVTSRTERSSISAREPTRARGGLAGGAPPAGAAQGRRGAPSRPRDRPRCEQERARRDERRGDLAGRLLPSDPRAEAGVDGVERLGALGVERSPPVYSAIAARVSRSGGTGTTCAWPGGPTRMVPASVPRAIVNTGIPAAWAACALPGLSTPRVWEPSERRRIEASARPFASLTGGGDASRPSPGSPVGAGQLDGAGDRIADRGAEAGPEHAIPR